MAKPVMAKCMATGEKGPRDTYYKAPNSRYFKSEEIYEAWMAGRRKEKAKQNKPVPHGKPGRTTESYKRICDTIADMIGYDPDGGQPMPTIVFRRLKELDYYSDEIIQKTLDESANSIRWAMEHKGFESDVGRASYMMAIVRNNIAEVDRREKQKKDTICREEKGNPDLDTMTDLENIGVVHKSHDVSSLLGGDDLWI